jgi:hypothetical protein
MNPLPLGGLWRSLPHTSSRSRAAIVVAIAMCAAVASLVNAAQAPTPTPAPPTTPTVPTPPIAPMISEVLAAVPAGDLGDANADGSRQVAGDEFIELFNPLDRPVSLRGMRLLDKDTIKKPDEAFAFPDVRLAPGQVCVVFNGHEATIPGPVGDSRAAAVPNPHFNGALVFSMRAPSSRRSLSNAGDFVLLTTADGVGLHMVRWGTLDSAVPSAKAIDEAPVNAKGSVARRTAGGAFVIHEKSTRGMFSPGVVPEALLRGRAGGAGVTSAETTTATGATPTAERSAGEGAGTPGVLSSPVSPARLVLRNMAEEVVWVEVGVLDSRGGIEEGRAVRHRLGPKETLEHEFVLADAASRPFIRLDPLAEPESPGGGSGDQAGRAGGLLRLLSAREESKLVVVQVEGRAALASLP